ncbi:MAG: cytochrome c biogenesis heme-transporting ATPase CcmA [Gammaproteobacteria bacterium]
MMLKVFDLTAERNERSLFSGLNFTLNPGEVLQVTGSNGAGKTTLLRMISGLLPLSSGKVAYEGNGLLYIGHALSLKGRLTPYENLQFSIKLAGCLSKLSLSVEEALRAVGLEGFETVETHTLSMGQQRRVNLARLLLIPANLWILDEPLAALDKQGIQLVESLILAHIAQAGMIVLTSHQLLSLENIVFKNLILN